MAVRKKYRDIVGAGTKTAGAVGIPGAFSFGLDVAVISTIWASMLIAIADRTNHKIDITFAVKVAAGVAGGAAGYIGGSKIAMKLLHLIPGAGSIAAMGVNGALNYIYTYKLGHALSNLFDKSDFDMTDANHMITDILTLVLGIPTLDELGDMTTMARESTFRPDGSIQRKTFEEYYSHIMAERKRRGI